MFQNWKINLLIHDPFLEELRHGEVNEEVEAAVDDEKQVADVDKELDPEWAKTKD